MAFIVEEVSVEMVEAVHPLVLHLKRRDPPLADQLSRAASSVTLNIAESNYSDPGNRRSRLCTAAGSANEVRAGLKIAVARHHCSREDIQASLALLDRVIAMLWKLTH